MIDKAASRQDSKLGTDLMGPLMGRLICPWSLNICLSNCCIAPCDKYLKTLAAGKPAVNAAVFI